MYAGFRLLYGHLLPVYGGLVAVRSPRDLEYLVKESEVITSRPGREFFAILADGLVRYRVSINGIGFEVSQVGEDGGAERFLLTSDRLPESALGHAMSEGQLFCKAVV